MNSIPIYVQQDAILRSLFMSVNCSTCFGWYLHPSSGANTTVSTASGICHNVDATCRYRGRVGTGLSGCGWLTPVYTPIYIQQDAILRSLLMSVNCSTCFGWYLHPSSGAHTTVSTASGVCHTVDATCCYRGRVGTGLSGCGWLTPVRHPQPLKPVPTLPR